MKKWLDIESKQFKRALEAEIELRKNSFGSGGFLIPQKLDQALGFTVRAKAIAVMYDITTEQACFAIVHAMKRMGWLKQD